MKHNLQDLLQPYKGPDDPTVAICLVDDLEAMRIAAVWPNLPKSWEAPRKHVLPADSNGRWLWLWDGCNFDWEELTGMSGVPTATAERKFWMLVSHRLLFPDGSVASSARGLIQSRIREALTRPGSRPRGRK